MMDRKDALDIIARCHAYGDFFALPASVVDALLGEADRLKYRAPQNANGSRGRYFYAYVTRRAGLDE